MSKKHTFEVKDGEETRVLTKAKAIRFHCLSCCGFQPSEVTKCFCVTCALFPFRFGNEKGLDTIHKAEDFDGDGNLIGEEPDEDDLDGPDSEIANEDDDHEDDEEIDWDDDDE